MLFHCDIIITIFKFQEQSVGPIHFPPWQTFKNTVVQQTTLNTFAGECLKHNKQLQHSAH